MALTQISFGFVGYVVTNSNIPVLVNDANNPIVSASITPNASTQSTTIKAALSPGKARPFCRVSTDTGIYFSTGASPNAQTDASRLFVPAGGVEYIVCNEGDICAVVNAP